MCCLIVILQKQKLLHCTGSDSISDFHVSTASGNAMTPSHYPPLHIAPIPSAESSDISLLDDYDSSKPQTRISYGGRKRISIAVIVPGILIFIASAGLATSLLIWLQSRRVESHIPREDQYFVNALVAIEGATAPRKLDDGSLESDTTMYGLAMSAVSVSPISRPFLSDDNNPPVGAAGISHCAIPSRFAGLSSGFNVDSCAGKGAYRIYANGSPVWPARQIMRIGEPF